MRLSQTSLPYKVLQNIKENDLIAPGEKIIVAVSGGADSVCLFDVLDKLKDELKITLSVCHYDHRMRGKDSRNDFIFVKKMATERGVEFIGGEAIKANLFKSEEDARNARYSFFEKILKEGRGDRVAIAHNKNDLAETFLIRLFRGSGMRGLRSIPSWREKFTRPLLPISRKEIEQYLKKENLPFQTDNTNFTTDYTRNFIRIKIIPLILQVNPNLIETISNNVASLDEDYDLLDKLTHEAYKKVLIKETGREITLSRKKWLSLHSSLEVGVIRLAISKISSLEDITYKQIYDVIKMVQKGEGKKFKPLPHSLRLCLLSGNIVILVEKTKQFRH